MIMAISKILTRNCISNLTITIINVINLKKSYFSIDAIIYDAYQATVKME